MNCMEVENGKTCDREGGASFQEDKKRGDPEWTHEFQNGSKEV